MIRRDRRGGVTILHLEHGKANALDVELLEALEKEVAAFEASDARALVLTGQGTIFSAGVDLFRVLEGGAAYVDVFLPLLTAAVRRVLDVTRPVVAAVNGHAIAGGCVLALACDHRVASEGKIGVPELLVGVPFPALAVELVRHATTPRGFRELVWTGKTVPMPEARELGLVDEVVPHAELLDRAVAAAERLAAMPPVTFAIAKKQVNAPLVARATADPTLERHVHETWNTDAVRGVIRAYLDRTLKKK